MSENKCLTLTDFPLQCGVVLPEIRLVYQVYGSYNADSFACAKGDRSNVILYQQKEIRVLDRI